MSKLTKEDWTEIYYALQTKKARLEEGEDGPTKRAWRSHLTRIMNKIGPDGQDAFAREHAPADEPHVVIAVEGGMVSHIFADKPIVAYTVDYDTDGAEHDDLVPVPQFPGVELAIVDVPGVQVVPGVVDAILGVLCG